MQQDHAVQDGSGLAYIDGAELTRPGGGAPKQPRGTTTPSSYAEIDFQATDRLAGEA